MSSSYALVSLCGSSSSGSAAEGKISSFADCIGTAEFSSGTFFAVFSLDLPTTCGVLRFSAAFFFNFSNSIISAICVGVNQKSQSFIATEMWSFPSISFSCTLRIEVMSRSARYLSFLSVLNFVAQFGQRQIFNGSSSTSGVCSSWHISTLENGL